MTHTRRSQTNEFFAVVVSRQIILTIFDFDNDVAPADFGRNVEWRIDGSRRGYVTQRRHLAAKCLKQIRNLT